MILPCTPSLDCINCLIQKVVPFKIFLFLLLDIQFIDLMLSWNSMMERFRNPISSLIEILNIVFLSHSEILQEILVPQFLRFSFLFFSFFLVETSKVTNAKLLFIFLLVYWNWEFINHLVLQYEMVNGLEKRLVHGL